MSGTGPDMPVRCIASANFPNLLQFLGLRLAILAEDHALVVRSLATVLGPADAATGSLWIELVEVSLFHPLA
ncbi:MAG: hypothetical protein CL981_07735 [Euryarchaeota archaeon]|nr:hypothetical protein [Euryarchaeota archaeon]